MPEVLRLFQTHRRLWDGDESDQILTEFQEQLRKRMPELSLLFRSTRCYRAQQKTFPNGTYVDKDSYKTRLVGADPQFAIDTLIFLDRGKPVNYGTALFRVEVRERRGETFEGKPAFRKVHDAMYFRAARSYDSATRQEVNIVVHVDAVVRLSKI